MSLPRMTLTVNDTISQPLFTIPLLSDFHFPNQLPLCLPVMLAKHSAAEVAVAANFGVLELKFW